MSDLERAVALAGHASPNRRASVDLPGTSLELRAGGLARKHLIEDDDRRPLRRRYLRRDNRTDSAAVGQQRADTLRVWTVEAERFADDEQAAPLAASSRQPARWRHSGDPVELLDRLGPTAQNQPVAVTLEHPVLQRRAAHGRDPVIRGNEASRSIRSDRGRVLSPRIERDRGIALLLRDHPVDDVFAVVTDIETTIEHVKDALESGGRMPLVLPSPRRSEHH